MHAGTPGPFRARLTEQAVVFANRRWLLLPMFAALARATVGAGWRKDPFCAASISAGGALRACDNDLLPEPEDRNGQHWMRVELGTIPMKFAFEISVQLWSPL